MCLLVCRKPDLRPQAWIFWGAILALTLQVVATSAQSTLWLHNQPAGTPYFFLTALSAIWSLQQFVNILLYPMLNLRKFNGWGEEYVARVEHASPILHVTFAIGLSCDHGPSKHSLCYRCCGMPHLFLMA